MQASVLQASVPDLKAKVAENGGCPVESQRLIYRGRVLKDDQSVSDYNIEDGHVLHLVARQPPPQNEGTSFNRTSAFKPRFAHCLEGCLPKWLTFQMLLTAAVLGSMLCSTQEHQDAKVHQPAY